ncbi:MAG: methyltransferase domain-containing protein [Chthonomonadaceae bacterium]|nr:methyltransferase domain-containing protein [Chthonomonadaceae bacterium]
MSDEYVLGTTDEEIERLALQHRVWRPWASRAWEKAQVSTGQRILDVGAGPGMATVDLAQIVGPMGRVTALELSAKFVEFGRVRCSHFGLDNVDFLQHDLSSDTELPLHQDLAWCRWVLSFVADPELVVAKLAGSLRTGGRLVIHEYLVYSTWRFMPPLPHQDRFMRMTEENWKSAGGDPDVGLRLPAMLSKAGLRVKSIEPILFAICPKDYAWNWPVKWVESSGKRLVEDGALSSAELESTLSEFTQIAADPNFRMLSPSVVEIIAEKS